MWNKSVVAKIGSDTAESEPANVLATKQPPTTPYPLGQMNNPVHLEQAVVGTREHRLRLLDRIDLSSAGVLPNLSTPENRSEQKVQF